MAPDNHARAGTQGVVVLGVEQVGGHGIHRDADGVAVVAHQHLVVLAVVVVVVVVTFVLAA